MNQKYDSKNRYPFKKIRRLRSEFNNQKQKKSQWRVPHRQQLDSDEPWARPILVESQPMDNSLGSIKKKWITHSYFIKTSFHSDKNTPKRKIKNLTHVDHFLY